MNKKTSESDNSSKKTVNELLGYPVDEDLDTEVFETEEPRFFDMSGDDEDEETTYNTTSSATPYQSVEVAASAAALDPIPEPVQQEHILYMTESTIVADMEVIGNVSSSSNMTISGRIIGDVVCGGSVLIGGEVDGDVSAAGTEIRGSIGDSITVAGRVTICNGAQVKGDIITHEAITGGTNGDGIKIEGKIAFQTPSIIMGNVCAKTFETSAGTKIKGLVKAYD